MANHTKHTAEARKKMSESARKRKGNGNLPSMRKREYTEAEAAALEAELTERAIAYLHDPARRIPKDDGLRVYTDEMGGEILARLADGESLRRICRDAHMPARQTVMHWIFRDKMEPFSKLYHEARREGLLARADDLVDIADDGTSDWVVSEEGKATLDKEHVMRSKLRVDTRKWELSKLVPNTYGDRIQHTGENGGPMVVQIVRFSDQEPE